MSKQSKKESKGSKEISDRKEPRSLKVASKGIKTSADFANMMSSLMSDLIEGRVTPSVGNSTCNAGGKLLKVVEMTYKYGTDSPGSNKRTLSLTLDDECDS